MKLLKRCESSKTNIHENTQKILNWLWHNSNLINITYLPWVGKDKNRFVIFISSFNVSLYSIMHTFKIIYTQNKAIRIKISISIFNKTFSEAEVNALYVMYEFLRLLSYIWIIKLFLHPLPRKVMEYNAQNKIMHKQHKNKMNLLVVPHNQRSS